MVLMARFMLETTRSLSCLPSWHAFLRFPIISIWKFCVDMATICSIQSDIKLM